MGSKLECARCVGSPLPLLLSDSQFSPSSSSLSLSRPLSVAILLFLHAPSAVNDRRARTPQGHAAVRECVRQQRGLTPAHMHRSTYQRPIRRLILANGSLQHAHSRSPSGCNPIHGLFIASARRPHRSGCVIGNRSDPQTIDSSQFV